MNFRDNVKNFYSSFLVKEGGKNNNNAFYAAGGADG